MSELNPISQTMSEKDYAHWLADKIPALGDYAKEAAAVLKSQGDEIESLRAKLADAEAKLASAEPVAWMRFCSDGGYEGPIADGDKRMSDVRKKSGAWSPLYTTPQPAPDVQAAVDAALEKAAEICVIELGGYSGQALADEIRAIPRDSSALDEYKADIKRLIEAIGVIPESAKVCLQSAGYRGLVDWIDRLKELAELKAKHNL